VDLERLNRLVVVTGGTVHSRFPDSTNVVDRRDLQLFMHAIPNTRTCLVDLGSGRRHERLRWRGAPPAVPRSTTSRSRGCAVDGSSMMLITASDAHVLTRSDLARGDWTVVWIDALGQTPELTLESGTTPADLRQAIEVHRPRPEQGAVVVVVALDAPTDLVIVAYEQGADTCIRGFDPTLVRAHLSALYRRRQQPGATF
jgi:hypothetical protein